MPVGSQERYLCPHCRRAYDEAWLAVVCWQRDVPLIIWQCSTAEMAEAIGCTPARVTQALSSIGVRKPYTRRRSLAQDDEKPPV